jgi:hypothetical protein
VIRRLAGPAGTAFCLLLATVLLLTAPLRDRAHDRVVSGRVGDTIGSRDLRLEVHAVTLTRTVVVDGSQTTSPGVFVIVDLTAEALRRPTSVLAEVVTGERRYDPSVRVTGGVVLATLTAGFPQRGALVYELPRDAIPGAVIRVDDHTTLELPVYLEVPLGVDEADVAGPVELRGRVDPAAVERSYR